MESSKNFSKCFQLIRNSKCPGCKWPASANQHALSSLLPLPRSSPLPFNYGVVCGPANGITVVDVDDYKSIKNMHPPIIQKHQRHHKKCSRV